MSQFCHAQKIRAARDCFLVKNPKNSIVSKILKKFCFLKSAALSNCALLLQKRLSTIFLDKSETNFFTKRQKLKMKQEESKLGARAAKLSNLNYLK